MGQGQDTYKCKSREVEAITGLMWDTDRAHIKARAGKWGNDWVRVGQGQDTYEGKSMEVEAMAERIWNKGRVHMKAGAGKWGQRLGTYGTRTGHI